MRENTARREVPRPSAEEGILCPICLLLAGQLIRGKIYCGNCGFIES